jgi:hypothetical protein
VAEEGPRSVRVLFYRNGAHFLDRIEELNWQQIFGWFILLLQTPLFSTESNPVSLSTIFLI